MDKFNRVYIEITNICNLACSFCGKSGRPLSFMDEKLFRRIIDQVNPVTKSVAFHVTGEPLMHPHLEAFIDYAHVSGLEVMITTNGTLLNSPAGNMISGKSLRFVNISLHAFSEIANKDSYFNNVFFFTKQSSRKNPKTYINLRLWNVFSNETKYAIDRINSEFGTCIKAPDKLNALRRNKHIAISENVFLHFDTRFQWPDMNSPEGRQTGFCYGLKSHFGILCDGTVIPCCLDADGIIPLGNIANESLLEILTGKRSTNMKENFKWGILAEELCRHCGYATRFKRKTRYRAGRQKNPAR